MGIRTLSLLLALVLVAFASRWYPDFKEGVEVSKSQNKLVMVYFYEEGCTYCKYMEEVVFIEPEVSDLMERFFVVVPIDVENPPKDLDRRFKAVGTPSFIIYDPFEDRVLLQIFGMQEADEFTQLLKRACSKSKRVNC